MKMAVLLHCKEVKAGPILFDQHLYPFFPELPEQIEHFKMILFYTFVKAFHEPRGLALTSILSNDKIIPKTCARHRNLLNAD